MKHLYRLILLYLTILLVATGCQQDDTSADKADLPVNQATPQNEVDRQLKINQDALLKGSSEQIRVDAATVMLFSQDPVAREILLDALSRSENNAARLAVCRALSRARIEQKPVENKQDFILPLFDILNTQTNDSAKLAAEATLIFRYEQISEQIEKIITDSSSPPRAKLNIIYVLKLHPDIKAIIKLIEMLDDPEAQVAAEAAGTLHALGIPVGKDPPARRQIIRELKRKGKDEFLRDWLIHQEEQLRKFENQLQLWQQLYLSALDKLYDSIGTDAAKGKFLTEYLGSPQSVVKLWALEKVSQWRVGTTSKLPAELGPVLVGLVSDSDRNVRLKTAKLLSLMGEIDSARQLTEQIKLDQDDEVKTELLVALGGACYYAFLPDSGIKIPPEIRKQTLEWAQQYLLEENPKKAQTGAEVIKKLLEQDGLAPADVNKYLGLLAQRYSQQKDKPDGALRGELLNAMAGLCARSVYKDQSAKLFRPLFEQALNDETDLVREAAVDGLIYIDKAKALKALRKDFVNDNSIRIRQTLIALAGEVGGHEDLSWLAEKIGDDAEKESAWQVMLKIFKRSDTDLLNKWIGKLCSQTTPNAKTGLSDEQKISFLEIAERKAVGENKLEMLWSIRKRLAGLYVETGEFERAAEYLGMMRQDASEPQQKQAILADLLNVYLKWPNVDAAAKLVDNCLLESDLGPNNTIVLSIDGYMSKPPEGTDPNTVLKTLTGIKTPQNRPMWAEHLKRWTNQLNTKRPKE